MDADSTPKDEYNESINNDGSINIDIVSGIFYHNAKRLFREIFTKTLEEQKIRLIQDGVSPELIDKYQVKTTMHKSKPKDPSKLCIANTKKGTPCRNSRREGYDYCGIHIKGAYGGNSYESRTRNQNAYQGTYVLKEDTSNNYQPTYIVKEDPSVSNKKNIDIVKRNPEEDLSVDELSDRSDDFTVSKEDTEIEANLEMINGREYIVWDTKIYDLPDGVDLSDRDDMNLDMSKLKLSGIKQNNGEIKWLD